MSSSSHYDEVVLWRKTLVLLTFISFLPSQMEGGASVSLGDLTPVLGSLLESCMVCFLADFWRNRHPLKLFANPRSFLTHQ